MRFFLGPAFASDLSVFVIAIANRAFRIAVWQSQLEIAVFERDIYQSQALLIAAL